MQQPAHLRQPNALIEKSLDLGALSLALLPALAVRTLDGRLQREQDSADLLVGELAAN